MTKTKLKKYVVDCEHYEPYYVFNVSAKNIKEARRIAEEKVDDYFEVVDIRQLPRKRAK